MEIPNKEEGLKRVIGVGGLALTIVGFTVGAGIFALPAKVGIHLGAFAVFAYLFCGIMLGAIMLCYAEIGSKITTSGGSYAYVEAAFGKMAGFMVSWVFFFGWSVLADAALLNVVADFLKPIFPAFANPWIRGIFFFVLLSFMVLINIRGAKEGVMVVKLLTVIKLLPLFAIIISGFGKIDPANLQWEQLPSVKTFGAGALLLFFAFAGFESALSASGEIKNPARTIPLGIFLGGMLVLIVYILLQTVTQGVLGAQMEAVKEAPLAAVAEKIVGTAGGTLLLLAGAVSCFGTVSADVLNAPRVLFAGANNGVFPKSLGKVHPKFATPYLSIISFGILIFILSIAGGFEQLAIMASAAILLVYLSVILATIKLRKKNQDGTQNTFRAPGGILTPVIGIAAIVWLLSSLTRWEILSTIIFVAVIGIIYILMKKLNL